MARRIAAHVTLVYPDEAPDLGLLVERLEAGVAAMDPFRLVLTDVGNWGDPEDGVFVHVVDADRGWAHLREWVLAPPFHALDVWPHVTLVHPRTSAAGPHAWRDLAGVRFDLEFVANAVAITGFDGRAWKTARILPLGQGEAARGRLVAAVLRRYGRVLLCRRSRDRSWYPGVWDLPGGHVEVGETAEAALVREIREELGIEVAEPSGTPLAVMEVEAAPGKGTFVLLVWVIDRWQGEITNQAPDEHDELSWVSRDELLSLRLAHPAFASLLSSAL